MTDASVPSSGTPREVLAGLGELTRQVRAAQRGAWFPLLLFGVLTLGGILVARLTTSVRTVTTCPPVPGSSDVPTSCTLVTQGSPLYWTLGLGLAYTAIAVFYVRRSRSRGVGTPVRPYILVGAALAGLAAATAFWSLRQGFPQPGDPLDFWGLRLDPASGTTAFLERFTGNAAAIGLPLLVLSWVERSRALLLLTAVYLAVELVPLSTGWAGSLAASPWSALPRLGVPGLLLLLGALGFRLAEPSRQRRTS
ncbi:hypothetical protein GCM10010495_00430 [Kitasatospora herbaricolor]|uniref:hypothetical protein n=1 Tax=Kitasatospora herbaricolor TaxID=68217 RepID=UPI00174894F6|nr:hypothetical protein [Kitasatospora herbaricolor]MDQ0311519.1 hypothetical protein [Kitasatospora herbaricolor]GGU94919.1 hypothetical protein GCM10010495_00430 [Kitasatospora herbaricolor]